MKKVEMWFISVYVMFQITFLFHKYSVGVSWHEIAENREVWKDIGEPSGGTYKELVKKYKSLQLYSSIYQKWSVCL